MISHSTGQPQDRHHVQYQLIVKKCTSSKTRAPTTVILGDSILKNVYSNIITKSVKHQKHVVTKHFPGAKIADMNLYKKPSQGKSSAEIIIHVVQMIYLIKNQRIQQNDIMQLAKPVKTDANKIACSSILQGKTNLIARQRMLAHMYKIYVLQITSL